MEGSAPHFESHSRAAPHSNGGAAGGNAFIAHDNVFGGPPKCGVTPRAEQYSKIFESFRSGKACSIPMLDLPPFDDSAAAFDFVGSSGFVYTEIFGGFDLPDFALSLDELLRRSDGRQESSESDAWTQVGTESLSEESDPSACSGRNQYFLNGDFHQTNDTKFNLSYHKVNMVTTEDSNVIHVAQLSPVLGNSYMYEGSSLQTEVEERFSFGVADDISLCEDSSGISAETQSQPASIPSHDSGEKNGRPHGINRSPTIISDSDVCITTEPSHVLRTSSAPPTAADRKNDPVSSMSDSARPKSNASKALFDVGSLGFLNAELDTRSSGIASAAAIKEVMDRAKLKLESARESTERKKDAVKGTRPVMKNDMNGNGKVRVVFDGSVLRDDELQPNHESEYSLFKLIGREMQDVSEASQVLPDPSEAEKNSVNGDAKPAQRKITKNQSSSEVAKREDNGRGLKHANQLEEKEEVCTQKGTHGRKRVVSPTDENLIVLNEALGQKEEPGKSGRKEKQQSDVWSKKADKESRKSENEMSEKVGRETKLKEVQKTDHCQKNVEEETMSDCYEKNLKHSVEMEKFEKLEVTIENNRTEKKIDAAHHLALKSLKLERSDNTDEIEDEVAEKEMKMLVQTSESENSQKMYEDSAINEELKMDKVDLYAELKSTEQYSYKGRHLNAESEYSTSSTGSCALYETKNKVPEMTFECEDLKSSNLSARLNEKNIAPEVVENAGKFRRKEEFERARLRELELEREKERERELEKGRITQLEEEREQEREKKLKLHLKRLEELREREREMEVDKDCLGKLEEERQGGREKKLEKECLGKLDDEWEREREREKDRMGVKLKTSEAHERVFTEADEMTERAAAEIVTAEARQRAMAEARERLEKACAVAREKSLSEKASTESRLRAERAAVARATAEACERAIEKAMAERDIFEAPEQVARSASEKFSSPLGDIELRHTSSSSDLWNSDITDEFEGESAQRGRPKLERHRRTVERVAKALAEKSTRDLIAQKEQAERNRLAESLDADIKRWSNGKEGNLRALLSTLQYILGPDSGWHPIPLTEIISSAAVKKAYRKATLCVHPDKLQQRGASTQQKYICEKVFDLLKDSWNRFNSEER